MLPTAEPYFSTRSAKSGRTCAEAPGIAGVTTRPGADAGAWAKAGTWAATPRATSALTTDACRVFMAVSLGSILGQEGGWGPIPLRWGEPEKISSSGVTEFRAGGQR